MPFAVCSLRKLTGGGDWQVVSRGPPQQLQGVVRVEHSLGPVQHEVFGEPTVLVVDAISGATPVGLIGEGGRLHGLRCERMSTEIDGM